LFWVGPPIVHKLQAGGPAQYPEAYKLSRKLFVDNLNFFLELFFYLWDKLG